MLWAAFAAAVAGLAYLVPVANVAFPGHRPIAIASLLGGIAVAIAMMQMKKIDIAAIEAAHRG